MKKKFAITLIVGFALLFTLTNDTGLVSAIQMFSPMGSPKAPTIPILPPIM